jgi:hypothetical protein
MILLFENTRLLCQRMCVLVSVQKSFYSLTKVFHSLPLGK